MLTIDSIDLHKFQGMWLNKIKRFTISSLNRYSLILGRNGCGKSRLINVLSLIAPNKGDFEVDGFRDLTVTKDNVTYQLYTLRTKGGFKCTIKDLTNDELLFDAVNPSVYNTAIKEMFDYDKDIHELITGKVVFTKMKTPERKKWFSILSESDLTYALGFYKKSREHLRDFTGSIKTTKHNIGLLQPKVIENQEELEQTRIRIDEMQKQISDLDKEISSIKTDYQITEQTLEDNNTLIGRINTEILSTEMTVDKITIKYNMVDVREKLTALNTTRELKMTELSELIKKVEYRQKIKGISLSGMKTTLDEVLGQIEECKSTVVLFPSLYDMDSEELIASIQLFEFCKQPLRMAIYELTNVKEPADVRAAAKTFDERLLLLNDKINKANNNLSVLNSYIDHIHTTDNVNCTRCGHSFKPGIGDNDLANIADKITEAEAQIKKLTEIQSGVRDNLAIYSEAASAVNGALSAMNSCANSRVMCILFDKLNSNNFLSTANSSNNSVVEKFREELELVINIKRLATRADKIKLDMQIVEAGQTEDYTELNERVAKLESELVTIADDIKYWESVADIIRDADARMERIDRMATDLASALSEEETIIESLAANETVRALTEERKSVWDLLIVTKQRFDNMERERVKLEFLENELESLTIRKDNAQQIVDALSPDGGILAKYLYQSITKVTDLMTGYINSIWGYEMGIKPCNVCGNELDYKFPFYANDATQVTEDVSMGSKAQQEVINFVFMLSVYQARGLVGYPLFLDELGSGFDEGHKPMMIEFIKGLIDRRYHSQMIMVSHDPATHFQLTHADVCVIDPNGITLPAVYNKNVTITY